MTAMYRSGEKPVTIFNYALILIGVFCFLTVGCGGGGGGDDGGTSPSLTYSGLSTPAEINKDNAQAIAAGAIEGGAAGTTFTGIASIAGSGQGAGDAGEIKLANVARAMESAISQMDFETAMELNLSAAVQSESGSIYGACGGSASYAIRVDSVTGAFSGSMTFSGYCEDGMAISGGTSFSGVVNVTYQTLESFTISFNYITGSSAGGSFAMSGQLSASAYGPTISTTMDMIIQDNNSARICMVQDYQMDLTDGVGYVNIVINGRFYDPDYGYVDLETTTAFRINDSDDYPNYGQLVISGEIGTAGGPTKARLTAISNTQCQVEADTDGDGSYSGPDDYDSGIILWADL